MCECARVCAHGLHKSDFLGNTDFNFKSFPGTLFKGRQLINYVGKIPHQTQEQRVALFLKFAATGAFQLCLNSLAGAQLQ